MEEEEEVMMKKVHVASAVNLGQGTEEKKRK